MTRGYEDELVLVNARYTIDYDELDNKPSIDAAPTSGSNNAVKSGGVYTALSGKQDTLTFDSEPTENSNNPVTSDGIYALLARIASLEDRVTALEEGGSIELEDGYIVADAELEDGWLVLSGAEITDGYITTD